MDIGGSKNDKKACNRLKLKRFMDLSGVVYAQIDFVAINDKSSLRQGAIIRVFLL